MAERVRLINPACRVTEAAEFFTASSAERLLAEKFSYVVDAIDRMSNKALVIGEAHARGLPVVTVGAAGGSGMRRRCARGFGRRVCGRAAAAGEEKLRRDHGFPHGEQNGKMHWGVRCVWSSEAPVFPWADGTCAAKPEPGSNLAMDCASGFGAAVFVTGTFGLVAAQEVVRGIVARAS